MDNKDIIFYSKKNGTNLFLFQGKGELFGFLKLFDDEKYKEHKQFVYALVSGIEIKLFS